MDQIIGSFSYCCFHKFSYFQEQKKAMSCDGYVTKVSLSLEILFGMLPLEAANTRAVNYSDRTYTFVRFDTSICPSNFKQKRLTKKTTARLFWTSQIIKDDAIVNHLHSLLVLFSRLGTIGQSFGGDAG